MTDPGGPKGRGGKDIPDDEGLSSYARGFRAADKYISASFALVAAVGVFTVLGIWVDKKLGSSPWFTLVGVIVGMTGGFIGFFKAVLGTNKKNT